MPYSTARRCCRLSFSGADIEFESLLAGLMTQPCFRFVLKGARLSKNPHPRQGRRWSVLIESPEWLGAADDCGGRQRPEISAVEGIRGLPVHQEHLPRSDEATAMPDGHQTSQMVSIERIADGDTIDEGRSFDATDGLTRKSEDAL